MKQTSTRLYLAGAAAAAAVAVLGGCERSATEDAPVQQGNEQRTIEQPPAPAPSPTASPAMPVETPTPEPSDEIAPDEQLQDDAEAAGMTSRLSREEGAANQTER